MAQKLIIMAEKELSKYDIIKNLIAGKINGTDAAKQIQISIRHLKRLKARVAEFGAKGLIHGNRGKESNRKISSVIVEKVKKLIKKKYYDFGPTFASEKLEEDDKIKISKEKVRGIMIDLDIWKAKPRKQPKKRHTWRPREDNLGEMQQFDGSYHVWFGKEESCLLLSVDDATGKITHGEFGYNEGVVAVFNFWLDYFKINGLPLSVYLDKFSTYKINHPKAVDNKELMTQFQRAMSQVDVKLITAHSPEAKGRIERMFETLQDRLVKELRLAKVTTMEEANKFLKNYIPKFNAKFAVVPNRKNNLHKKPTNELTKRLSQIFSVQDRRIINNDYTIMFKNRFYQLDEIQPVTVYKKDAVTMEEHLDGSLKISYKNHYLNYTVLPKRPKKEIDIKLPAITNRKVSGWKPPIDHPWRKSFSIGNKSKINQPNPTKINS